LFRFHQKFRQSCWLNFQISANAKYDGATATVYASALKSGTPPTEIWHCDFQLFNRRSDFLFDQFLRLLASYKPKESPSKWDRDADRGQL
jgi:hypothetical protein